MERWKGERSRWVLIWDLVEFLQRDYTERAGARTTIEGVRLLVVTTAIILVSGKKIST